MLSSCAPLSRELRALLERERAIPRLPAPVCARALARARAAIVAGAAPRHELGHAARHGTAVRAAGSRWLMVVTIACLVNAAVGATAGYALRAHLAPAPSRPAAAEPIAVVATPPAPPTSPTPIAAVPVADLPPAGASAATRRGRRSAVPSELRLLHRARAAVAREEFAVALPPLAEHARRFTDGRLTEEREALRVRTLAGLGRTDEARRAADAFGARFPHSVLLPAVSEFSYGRADRATR